MCGLAGIVEYTRSNNLESIANRMIDTITHRGPDAKSIWVEENSNYNIAMAHTRLSIIDLSSSANQPMLFDDLVIVINGEIYNYSEIKNVLKALGHEFITQSDTEVILHSFKQWGLKCVDHFIGMFAIVLFDKNRNEIHLIRDRFGVKPLFYTINEHNIYFASELKAIIVGDNLKLELRDESIIQYLEYGYIKSPNTIYKSIRKIEPGSYITINLLNQKIENVKYWDISDLYKRKKNQKSTKLIKKELVNILSSAFSYRMVSDVPIGIFQSGGYDSTAVTALLSKFNNEKLNTYTIAFPDGDDESSASSKIASHLKTNHHILKCEKKDAIEIIEQIPILFDEPFADSSAIPTLLVSRLAKEHVKVVLSADGGDELFGGYSYYSKALLLYNILYFFPLSIKRIFYFIARKTCIFKKNNRYKSLLLCDRKDLIKEIYLFGHKIDKKYLKQIVKIAPSFNLDSVEVIDDDFVSTFLLNDAKSYLENDILVKVDRCSMYNSIEAREPLLDHRLFEYVAQLPNKYKFNVFFKKKILKSIVHEFVPKDFLTKRKQGFSLPIRDYLRNDLSYLLDKYINENKLNIPGFFNSDSILKIKREFIEKNKNFDIVWRVLVFQIWFEKVFYNKNV